MRLFERGGDAEVWFGTPVYASSEITGTMVELATRRAHRKGYEGALTNREILEMLDAMRFEEQPGCRLEVVHEQDAMGDWVCGFYLYRAGFHGLVEHAVAGDITVDLNMAARRIVHLAQVLGLKIDRSECGIHWYVEEVRA
jgi:hypothetical protein